MAMLNVADSVACERLGLPQTRAAAWLAGHFTPVRVFTPALGFVLCWLEVYRAGAYPDVFYYAAEVERI